MTQSEHGTSLHPAARTYVTDYEAGRLSRREFMARTTALGITAAGAYALIGATPAKAEAHQTMGGTLRMQIDVFALKDPRNYDLTQISYCVGWLEYLIEYNNDGTFTPRLLTSWEVNEDATVYTLNVRQGVTWNDGTPFTAEDVAFNITRWCEADAEGNSMASRMSALVDPETNVAIEGAIVVVDEHTVQLNLPAPDITLIAGMADYPAAIVPQDFNPDTMWEDQKGTGPYRSEEHSVGIRSVLVRNEDHDWWGYEAGAGAYLDRIEFLDYGTDPIQWFTAAEAGEVDALYETVGEFIDLFTDFGWQSSEVQTAATIVIRPNQRSEPLYADKRVRQAIIKAVDNSVCLELGQSGRGTAAQNHHVAPVHPEYAEVDRLAYDPEAALALLEEAGAADHEFDIVSIDDDWRRNTTDAVAAQLRDAGFNVKRTVLPASTFWNDWVDYPFSATNWNHRPLGTQILGLAYRSGVPWNEFGFANEEFDALLTEANSIADADARSEVMAKLEAILVEEAVTIQPFWRSLFRHARPGTVGVEMHIAYLPQFYKWSVEA